MLYAGQVPNKIQTRKHLPPNPISFSYFSSQRIILTLVSRFHSSYYLCHFWVDCTGNPWFPRGFPPVAPAPVRQLRVRQRFRRCFSQVRRFGAQLAAEGSAPGRAAAVWAQLLQQLSWGSMILGVWLIGSMKKPWKKPWALGLFSRILMIDLSCSGLVQPTRGES